MQTQDKVALVTGANKGIGLETARGLSELGIAVVIASRDEAKGRAAAEKLKAEGKKNVEAVRFDVTRLEDHQEIARHLENRYGKLDILVNNAGVMLEENDFGEPGGFNTTPTVTPDLLRRTFETNFFAVVSLTQAFFPLIRKAPAGRIVNVSSGLGSLTMHSDPSSNVYHKKNFAYDASKTALNAFTVHLAQRRCKGLRSRSTRPIPVGSGRTWAARRLQWRSPKGARQACSLQPCPTTAQPVGFSTSVSRCHGDANQAGARAVYN